MTLKKPNRQDVTDYRCSGAAPQLRLVRHVTPDGLLENAFGLLGANSHKRRPGRKSARPNRHVKPPPSMAYKG